MASSYRFVVAGRVQGVGFRWSAQRQAQQLGIAGWIANRSDGAVEGIASGESPALAQFKAWLSKGPTGAQVDDVDWQPASESFAAGFEIRR
jgi:acylphosphatase